MKNALIIILVFIAGFAASYLIPVNEPVIENFKGAKIVKPDTVIINSVVFDSTKSDSLRNLISKLTRKLIREENRPAKVKTITKWRVREVPTKEGFRDEIVTEFNESFKDEKLGKFVRAKVLTYAPSIVDSIQISGEVDFKEHFKEIIEPQVNKPLLSDEWSYFAYGVVAAIVVTTLTK